jgi:hypothetical protein
VRATRFSCVSHQDIPLDAGSEYYITEIRDRRDEGIKVGMDIVEHLPLRGFRVSELPRSVLANPMTVDPIPERMTGITVIFIIPRFAGTLVHRTNVEENVEERLEIVFF